MKWHAIRILVSGENIEWPLSSREFNTRKCVYPRALSPGFLFSAILLLYISTFKYTVLRSLVYNIGGKLGLNKSNDQIIRWNRTLQCRMENDFSYLLSPAFKGSALCFFVEMNKFDLFSLYQAKYPNELVLQGHQQALPRSSGRLFSARLSRNAKICMHLSCGEFQLGLPSIMASVRL